MQTWVYLGAEVGRVDLWPNAILEEEGFRSSEPEDPNGETEKKNTTWEWIMAEVESESLVNSGISAEKTLKCIAFEKSHTQTKVVLASDWSWSLRQNGLYHKLSEVGGLA